MAVLGFQIFFILLIALSSFFGKSTRNWIILISVIFTIFAVFTSGLMIIQFISIFIGFLISESIFSRYNQEKLDNCLGAGCLWLFVIIIVLIILSLISNYWNSNDISTNKEKGKTEKTEKDSLTIDGIRNN